MRLNLGPVLGNPRLEYPVGPSGLLKKTGPSPLDERHVALAFHRRTGAGRLQRIAARSYSKRACIEFGIVDPPLAARNRALHARTVVKLRYKGQIRDVPVKNVSLLR